MRNLASVIVAVLVVSVLAISADYLMFKAFAAKFDDQGVAHDLKILVAMLCYTVALYVLGGYIAKRGMLFGLAMLVLAFASTVARYDTAPRWFHIANLASILPCAVVGAKLRGKR